MLVFACDPGGSSGWATYDTEIKQFDGGQLETNDHHLELWELINGLPIDDKTQLHIVTESFEFRNNVDTEDRRKGLELISRDYIGIMKLYSKINNCKYVEQQPVAAKKFVPDARIEALDLMKYPKHPNRHYHDALRHLLLYVVYRLRIREGIVDKWKRDKN